MMVRTVAAVVLTAAPVLAATQEAPLDVRKNAVAAFTTAPTAAREGDVVQIRFAAASATDVEVAVLNATGGVVRHLAAGLLGANAPAPLRNGMLTQELTWDGRDDAGKPVAAPTSCRVRVGLGLTAGFDRIIGWSGQEIEDVRGLCCGPDGTLYLFYGGQLYAHRRTTIVSAFDREGNYLRQVLPGPAGLPADKRAGWPHLRLEDGREVPVVQHMMSRALNPAAVFDDRIFPAALGDGRLLVLNGCGESLARVSDPDVRSGRQILILNSDGSVSADYLGPSVAEETATGSGCIVTSADGRFALVTGLAGQSKKGKQGRQPYNVVYRVPLSGGGKPEPVIGKLREAGGGDRLNDPLGLAVDAQDNVYVSDFGNNRIAVFTPAGKLLKEIHVASPWQVAVSRRTGAIYVIAEKGARLVKFGSLADPAGKASVPTGAKPYDKVPTSTLMALDDSSEPHGIWLVSRNWHNGTLRKFVDMGAAFEDRGDLVGGKVKKNSAINFTGSLVPINGKVVTREADFGYNWNTRPLVFDSRSGECEGLFAPSSRSLPKTAEAFPGKDGLIYFFYGGYGENIGRISKVDLAGKSVLFAGTGRDAVEGFWHGHTRSSGLFADAAGGVYVFAGPAYRQLNGGAVYGISPDGKVINSNLVKVTNAYIGGLGTDSRGNIYVCAQVAPKEELIPGWFKGRLPPDTPQGYPSTSYRQYGSVIKFPPTGGAIEPDAAGAYFGVMVGEKRGPVSLRGALWAHRGGLVPVRGGKDGLHCYCETSRLDIDAYDRIFVPDIGRFAIQVLDSAGNAIGLIGSYGNMDSRGPGSPHPDPAIAYAWPLAAQVAGDRLFVADETNRRIVVARLNCATSVTCPIQ